MTPFTKAEGRNSQCQWQHWTNTDSAAGGLIEARDAEYSAIFPIRGKIIAAYKNTTSKVFANQEVVNLIKAIGLELDPKTNKLIYDSKKLRYGKILLAADAKRLAV